MKRLFLVFVSILILTSMTFTITVHAESAENWYIVKKANSAPDFPESSEYLREHACYFIDQR